MNVTHQRLPQKSEDVHAERRKVPRASVSATAILATAHGDRVDITIGDVSTHGCNIRSDVDWLKIGRFVSIEYGAETPLQAVVRWVRNGAAGLEFLRPVGDGHREWQGLIDSGWEG